MIIKCLNCLKQFTVNSDLIPDTGRRLICGSCNYSWDFKLNKSNVIEENNKTIEETINIDQTKKKIEYLNLFKKTYSAKINNSTIYLIVFIISFIAALILVDTFKSPLINIFPGIEIVLFNLFETLKDIKLFIIDLI